MTRDELINAIDSPIVQALARVFDTPPQRMDKSFSEQIVEILAPKLINVPAQGARVPKARTSHHRNKEEAARLQELVAKRYAPAQCAPMRDDISQIISDGWKSGKSSIDVAEEILREFDTAPAQGTPNLTDEALDASLSEYWDMSPRVWPEPMRMAMRKAITTALTSTECGEGK